jgi:hypothetical protein
MTMRLDYLGDSLDHWKGSLLGRLRAENLLRPLRVVPMLTDGALWSATHHAVYCAHLGLAVSDLISTKVFDGNVRADYFKHAAEQACRDSDLFIDPDKGIEPSRCKKEHVSLLNLCSLATGDRLLLVYEQTKAYGSNYASHVDKLSSRLGAASLFSVFWTGRQVAMAAISRDASRVAAIRRHWHSIVGPLAERRILPHVAAAEGGVISA